MVIVNTKTTICINKTNPETLSINDLLENIRILLNYILSRKMKKVKSKLKQSDWDKIEKEFLKGFINYFYEINDSINLLRKNKGNPLIRSQLCLVFICIDAYARFHRIFLGWISSIV